MRSIGELVSRNTWKFVLASFSMALFSSCASNPVETIIPVVARIMYETGIFAHVENALKTLIDNEIELA